MGYIEEPVHEYEIPTLAGNACRDAMQNFAEDFAFDNLGWQLMGLNAAGDWIEQEKARVVQKMRAAGASWSEVGDALGITKQGAVKKYGK